MKTSTRLSLNQFGRGIIYQVAVMMGLLALVVLIQRESFTLCLPVNALLVVAVFPISVIIHESAHAIAAKLVGLEVKRVQVGGGAIVWRGSVFGVDIHVGSLPFSGRCLAIPTKATGARWRYWLCVAAGPLASAAILATVWQSKDDGWRVFLQYDAVNPLGVVFVANALVLGATLIPWGGGTAGAMAASDGKLLLTIPFMRDFDGQLRGAHHALEAAFALEQGDVDGALSWAEKGLSRVPDSASLLCVRGSALLRKGDMKGAREIFLELRDRPGTPVPVRDVYENNIAWASIFLDDPALHEEALRAARRVAVVRELEAWAHGTYGSALVRCGKPHAAMSELERAYGSHNDDTGRAHNAAWIALAEAMRGHPELAQKWLATARELDPACISIPFAERKVDELQTSG
jgi:tetratricopeptide (TPR) repeat protein